MERLWEGIKLNGSMRNRVCNVLCFFCFQLLKKTLDSEHASKAKSSLGTSEFADGLKDQAAAPEAPARAEGPTSSPEALARAEGPARAPELAGAAEDLEGAASPAKRAAGPTAAPEMMEEAGGSAAAVEPMEVATDPAATPEHLPAAFDILKGTPEPMEVAKEPAAAPEPPRVSTRESPRWAQQSGSRLWMQLASRSLPRDNPCVQAAPNSPNACPGQPRGGSWGRC